MKCPNCQCEISSNERICRYCGFDIETSLKETVLQQSTGSSTLLRAQQGEYYRNAMQFYEENYRKEKEKNQTFVQVTVVILAGLVIILNFIEIFLVLCR